MSARAGTGRTPPNPTRRTVVSLLQAGVGVTAAVVLLVWGLPHFAKTSWGEVWQVVSTVPLLHAIGFQGLMLVGLYCYTFTLTSSLPGLGHAKALIVNLAGSSVGNLLPGGGAAGLAATYTICRSWGFHRRDISTSALVTGVWNVVARVILPVVAIVGLWVGNHADSRALQSAAIAGATSGAVVVAVFVAIQASPAAAAAVGRTLDRLLAPLLRRRRRRSAASIEALIVDMRERTNDVVTKHWLGLTLGLVGFFGFYYLLFVLVMHSTGVDLPYGQLFAAFAIGRLMTAVGVTPGGLGLTETATAAALVGWGAVPADAMAGVVLFSIFTHVIEIPLGGLGWLLWSVSPKNPALDEDPAPEPA